MWGIKVINIKHKFHLKLNIHSRNVILCSVLRKKKKIMLLSECACTLPPADPEDGVHWISDV